MTEPLVSVVTPVFNGEPYIRDCIESVLAQTYIRWDYTIINNCSTDATREIALEYARSDSRIRVHSNTEFARVIANYNNAFRQVSPQSTYCKALAADDWLFPECLARMVSFGEAHPDVVIIGSYNLLGDRVMFEDVVAAHGTIVDGRRACRHRLMGDTTIFGAASIGLMRSATIRSRDPFYNESNLHADIEACFDQLEHGNLGFVPEVLTFRRVQPGSLTSLSERLNTYQGNRVAELLTYGPRHLTAAESRERQRQLLDEYYRYLATQLFQWRDRVFWNFHRNKLEGLGLPLSRVRLWLHALKYALALAVDPSRMSRVAFRRLRDVLGRLTATSS